MKVSVTRVQQATIVALEGDVDASSAPEAQAQILPLAESGAKIALDMTGVPYMSSAGLRMLLATYRAIAGKGGEVVLVGLSSDLQDTMSLTGFLEFFKHFDTLDAGLAALA
jgi:anti-sigma B factor antagonist